MKYFIPILLALLSFYACSEVPEKKLNEEDAKKIPANFEDAQEINMSEIFKEVKYITLEVQEDNKIGSIEKMMVTDSYIALLDVATKCVWVFDRHGSLVNQINVPVGRGPGEVLYLGDFDIDKQNRIHALGKNKMVVYSLEDELESEFRIKYPAYKFAYLDDLGQYVFYAGNSLFKSADITNIGSNLVFLNSSGELEAQALPIKMSTGGLTLLSFNNFPVFNGKTLFYGHSEPIIYEIVNGQVKVRYKLNFGKYSVPQETYKLSKNYESSRSFFQSEVKDKGLASSFSFFHENDKGVYFIFNSNGKPNHVFFNKEKNASFITSDLKNDLDYGVVWPFRAAINDELFTIVQPYDLIRQVEYVRKNYPDRLKKPRMKNIIALTDTISTYDNPIIMVATIE